MGKHRHATREPGMRQLRVGELLRHALAEVLNRDEVQDPDVAGRSITVTEVTVSVDMRNATVFVEPLGGRDAEAVIAGLNRSAGFLSSRVARSVRMKYVPRLTFRQDVTFDNAERIDAILKSDAVRGDLDDGA